MYSPETLAKARTKISAAKVLACKNSTYMSSAILSLIPVPVEGMGTFACDERYRMYFDPDKTAEMEVEHLSSCLEHECWHILREHFSRCGNRDPKIWNIAGDCEINDDLVSIGRKFPFKIVTPDLFKQPNGLVAEHYYEHIMENHVQPGSPNPYGSGNSGEPNGDGNSSDSSQANTKNPSGASVIGKGGCGSAAGNAHAAEQKAKESGEKIPDGLTPADAKNTRKEVARSIQQAAQKSRGTIPGDALLWANQQLEPPKIDWRKALALKIRRALAVKAGQVDFTYTRIARRQASLTASAKAHGRRAPIMPGMYMPHPKVVMVLDTSGSMMADECLSKCFAEVMGIVKAVGSPVEAIAFDMEKQADAKIAKFEDLKKIAKGGGGTDMRGGLIEAAKKKPDVVILLTDGYTPWPDDELIYKCKNLIVACTTNTEIPKNITNVVRIDS